MDTSTSFINAFVWPDQRLDTLAIIPAYNEEACIGDVVRGVRRSGIRHVVVVNDGSLDDTAAEARTAGAHVLSLPYNLGIGGAVQAGLKFAVDGGYPYVIRLDGDGQHNVEEIGKLLEVVRDDKVDVAIGSRFFPGEHTYRCTLSRAIGIRWFAAMISWITGQPAYDTTSGMQALNRRALTVLAANYPQDYPEVETRILLHKARLRVIEIPVTMSQRASGMSSITVTRAIYYVLKVSLATMVAALRQAPRVHARDV